MLHSPARSSQTAPVVTDFLPLQRFLLPLMIVALLLTSLIAFTRGWQKTVADTGAIDLHPYWYYGHFVRMGVNPYTAFAAQAPLPAAAHYWDGSEVAADAVRQKGLAQIPANTASTLLISALLSYVPWNQIKFLWFAFNVVIVLATPWLAVRLLPPSLQISRWLQWLTALAFYAMKGQRVALVNGQPSVFVFFLMLVALLLRRKHWFWAGLALGVALGKYSLALPVALFMLFDKRFRVLIVAALVQALSLLAVSVLRGGSLWDTLVVYWKIVTIYADSSAGAHLGYLLKGYPALLLPLVILGTLVTLGMVVYSWRQGWTEAHVLPVNSALALWTVLAAYHRVYDTMVALLFWILCWSAVTTWQLPRPQRYLLGGIGVLSIFFLCLPGEFLELFLSEAVVDKYFGWIDPSIVVAMIAIWAVNLWLMLKTPRVEL